MSDKDSAESIKILYDLDSKIAIQKKKLVAAQKELETLQFDRMEHIIHNMPILNQQQKDRVNDLLGLPKWIEE